MLHGFPGPWRPSPSGRPAGVALQGESGLAGLRACLGVARTAARAAGGVLHLGALYGAAYRARLILPSVGGTGGRPR